MLDPGEAVLFVAMTRDNAVWRLPFMKDGNVSKVGRFCSMFGASGPDGMTVDKAGRLFVAHASLGPCVRVRSEWRAGGADQILRGTELHQCRYRRCQPGPPLRDGIRDRHRACRRHR